MTFSQYEELKHRHSQLVAQFNETESDGVLEEIAVIESVLYAAGYLTYSEEPFADLETAPAPSGDDERSK